MNCRELLQTSENIFIELNRENKISAIEQLNDAFSKMGFFKIKDSGKIDNDSINDTNFPNLYLFIHASDYLDNSYSHFEALKKGEPIIVFFNALKSKEEYIRFYKEKFKIKICWYKHELRSCSVYKPLQNAKKKYDKESLSEEDKKQYEKELIEIFDMHDTSQRNELRKNIIELCEKEELTKEDKNSIKEAKKKHI